MSSSNFPTALDTVANLFTAVNGISTTLNGAHDAVVTTLTVIDTTNFPTAGYVVIDTEIISYTGKTGTSFTGCTRGADSSTAAAHTTASVVAAYTVADHHNILVSAIIALQTLLGNSSQHVDLTARLGYGIKLKSSGGITWILTVDDNGNAIWTQG